jgi:hypothetical protein
VHTWQPSTALDDRLESRYGYTAVGRCPAPQFSLGHVGKAPLTAATKPWKGPQHIWKHGPHNRTAVLLSQGRRPQGHKAALGLAAMAGGSNGVHSRHAARLQVSTVQPQRPCSAVSSGCLLAVTRQSRWRCQEHHATNMHPRAAGPAAHLACTTTPQGAPNYAARPGEAALHGREGASSKACSHQAGC